MLLRQVQARPLQGHHLRALRRRGDAAEGAPRAHGPHRPRRARLAHLVLQGRPEPHRLPARHRPARAREGALLRRLDRHRGRRREARQKDLADLEDKVQAESERIYVDRDEQLAALEDRLTRRRDYFTKGKERDFDEDDEFWARGLSQLGRGAGPADARGGARARRRASSSRSPRRSRPRTRRRSASSSATRRSATTAGSTPRELENGRDRRRSQIREALAPLHKELAKATGSKKGAVTKHINRILDGAARRRRARRARTPSSSPAST